MRWFFSPAQSGTSNSDLIRIGFGFACLGSVNFSHVQHYGTEWFWGVGSAKKLLMRVEIFHGCKVMQNS